MTVTFFTDVDDTATDVPFVTLSNAGAAHVLRMLGVLPPLDALAEVDGDGYPAGGTLAGELDARLFADRVTAALSLAPDDPGMPSHAAGGIVVEAGRLPGYMRELLDVLAELAEVAGRGGWPVRWV